MTKPRSRLRDLSGTTLALTSLAILGAAAVVSAPVWLYYRRKRKRTDALLAEAAKAAAAAAEAKATERPPALEPGPARDTSEGGPVPPSPSTPPPAPPTAGPSGS